MKYQMKPAKRGQGLNEGLNLFKYPESPLVKEFLQIVEPPIIQEEPEIFEVYVKPDVGSERHMWGSFADFKEFFLKRYPGAFSKNSMFKVIGPESKTSVVNCQFEREALLVHMDKFQLTSIQGITIHFLCFTSQIMIK